MDKNSDFIHHVACFVSIENESCVEQQDDTVTDLIIDEEPKAKVIYNLNRLNLAQSKLNSAQFNSSLFDFLQCQFKIYFLAFQTF